MLVGVTLSGCSAIFGEDTEEIEDSAPTKPVKFNKLKSNNSQSSGAAKRDQITTSNGELSDTLTESEVKNKPAHLTTSPTASSRIANKPKNQVEIIWGIPDAPVDSYQIEYQLEGARKVQKLEVSTTSIDKIDHPNHGYVFRYLLDQIPPGKGLKVRITGKYKGDLSAPSDVFEIPGGRQ